MNFDSLKNDWNAKDVEETNISPDLLKIKEARTPIDIIRRKMKHEFNYQVVALIILALLPYLLNFSPNMKLMYLAFYAITCGFTAYYFLKFYRFYKNSYDMSMDSRKSILWFYYEMKLNIELYKALTYIIAFIGVAFISAYLFVEQESIFVKIATKLSPVYILLNCFATILIIGAITELWAWYYYGKYLKRVKNIVDELDFES
ncbi:hypothetical protein DHW03_06800 [Pedobacter yonginense]|uniref:DUF3278 domain-containing protein n=1 Tax=Pedobacter yonginense TaxID=651869 RepID=A0A317ESW8_9SPHI|nr:hypothetical protein [Pedobacter yonginense]PWS29512.1 hypothetical protein DHW03_06800 [Pedobacter yonginense]